jgi:hypothetical protein
MVRGVVSATTVIAASVACLYAASNAAIEKLEAEVLAKFKNTPPATIIQVLGAPNAIAERDDKEYLTWESGKSTGIYVYGSGGSESYSCRATFEFVTSKLAKVSLLGTGSGDRSLCKKLMKPLLTESTQIPSDAAVLESQVKAGAKPQASPVVTNADVLKLAAAGLPDSVILAKINSSPCSFDLSTDALVALKQAGVPDPIIEVMMTVGTKK